MRFQSLLVLVVTFLVSLSGLGCTYRPGELVAWPDGPSHAARTRGCLDVAVVLADDERIAPPSAVLDYRFGNRCERSATVDLVRVAAFGVAKDGSRHDLTAFDPQSQIHPLPLEVGSQGSEAIRYDVFKSDTQSERFEKICVDLTRIADDGVVVRTGSDGELVCLAVPGDPVVVDERRPGFARARGSCVDQGPGFHAPRDCSDFGFTWSAVQDAPRVVMSIGTSYHAVSTSDLTLHEGSLGSVPASVTGDTLHAVTFDLGIKGFVANHVYLGGVIGLGGGPASSGALAADSRARIGGGDAQLSLGGVFGVTTPRFGILQGRAEIYGGGRAFIVAMRPSESAPANATESRRLVGGQGILQPRLGVDVWAHPHVAIGAWAGPDLLHEGSVSGGLSVTLHFVAFDQR